MTDLFFLAGYVASVAVAAWRTRRLAWVVVTSVVSISGFGLLINFTHEFGVLWSRASLQGLLLVALAAVTVASFLPVNRFKHRTSRISLSRSFVSVGIPVLALLAFLVLITWVLTDEPAFLRPVSYLIGHGTAEDNAKWLDFTAKYATGAPISQSVALGGPLQLVLTFVGTLMGAISVLMLGGYNEVAVAANTVVFGSLLLAVIAPLALAPLVEGVRRGRGTSTPIPWPSIWLGSAVLVASSLVVTGFGHLTFQYTLIVVAVWSAVFLSNQWGRRGLLFTSLAVAATMTVWLPLNALALTILATWLVVFVVRAVRGRQGAVDLISWLAWAFAAVALFRPLWSTFTYVAGGVLSAASSTPLGGTLRGVAAVFVPANDNSLFSSPGGTEQVGPVLGLLAAVSLVGAAWLVMQGRGASSARRAVGLAPVGLLVTFSIAITFADFWVTGEGPHYGSLKFTFLAAVVTLATCVPLAVVALDWPTPSMTVLRWAAVFSVGALLVLDTLLPRALATVRPSQWSPPIPFNNTSGSYWYPAEVNGTGTQAIADNPVACVYLPPGASVPSAIVDSQLSDAQRVYSCTRILSGLAGMDSEALGLVDWLRREWLTNSRAWAETYPVFEGLPESVKAKKVILLDDGSNVIGLESFGSLLDRFPKFAGKSPDELVAMGIDPAAQ